MSLKNDDPPAPPSVQDTTKQQLDTSKQVADYNASLSRHGQFTPFGASQYVKIGKDSNGADQYANVQTLSPQIQALYNQQMGQSRALNQTGLNLLPRINNALMSPLPNFNDAYQQAYKANYDRGAQNLDPQYKNLESDLNTRLANQGVMEGSQAWNRAHEQFGRERDYAYRQLADSAQANAMETQGKGIQNALTLQNAPLQQLMAIRAGTQPMFPSFSNQFTPPHISEPNTADMTYRNYAAQQDAYNAQTAQNNNMWGGLMQLGASYLMR